MNNQPQTVVEQIAETEATRAYYGIGAGTVHLRDILAYREAMARQADRDESISTGQGDFHPDDFDEAEYAEWAESLGNNAEPVDYVPDWWAEADAIRAQNEWDRVMR